MGFPRGSFPVEAGQFVGQCTQPSSCPSSWASKTWRDPPAAAVEETANDHGAALITPGIPLAQPTTSPSLPQKVSESRKKTSTVGFVGSVTCCTGPLSTNPGCTDPGSAFHAISCAAVLMLRRS